MEVNGPGPIQRSFPLHQARPASEKPSQPRQPEMPKDELDLSPLARKIAEAGDLREARLAQIKAAIEAGEYETPEKLEAAVDRLLDELLKKEP